VTYHHPRFCTVGDTLTKREQLEEERAEQDSDLSTALEHLHQCRLYLARVDAAEYLDDRLDAIETEIMDVRNAL
jgi:hypothetical protein